MLIQFQLSVTGKVRIKCGGEINTSQCSRAVSPQSCRAGASEKRKKRKCNDFAWWHSSRGTRDYSRFIDTNDKHGCVVSIFLIALVHLKLQLNCGIVSIYCITLPSLPSLSAPPLFPGIGCSLQVHQVLYISHQLWSYLHFAAHLLRILMACVKKWEQLSENLTKGESVYKIKYIRRDVVCLGVRKSGLL